MVQPVWNTWDYGDWRYEYVDRYNAQFHPELVGLAQGQHGPTQASGVPRNDARRGNAVHGRNHQVLNTAPNPLPEGAFYNSEGTIIWPPEPQRVGQFRSPTRAPASTPLAPPESQRIDQPGSPTLVSTSMPPPLSGAEAVSVANSAAIPPPEVPAVPSQTQLMNNPAPPAPVPASTSISVTEPSSAPRPIAPATPRLIAPRPIPPPLPILEQLVRQAPVYGQLLTDPLNNPTAATEMLGPRPRQIPPWRALDQGGTAIDQRGAQYVGPFSASSATQVHNTTASYPSRLNFTNTASSRQPQASWPQRLTPHNSSFVQSGYMPSMTGLQPYTLAQLSHEASAPLFGPPNTPGVYQQFGSNPPTGLRAPIALPVTTTAAQGSHQWEPSLGFTASHSGPAVHQNAIPLGYDGRASSAYPASHMGPRPSTLAVRPVHGPRQPNISTSQTGPPQAGPPQVLDSPEQLGARLRVHWRQRLQQFGMPWRAEGLTWQQWRVANTPHGGAFNKASFLDKMDMIWDTWMNKEMAKKARAQEAVEGSRGLDRGTKRTRAEADEGDGEKQEDGEKEENDDSGSRSRGDAHASDTAPEHTPQHTDKKPKKG